MPDIRTVLLCPCFADGPGADQHKFVAYLLAGTGNDRTDIVIYVAYSRCLLIAKSQGVETGVSKKLEGGANLIVLRGHPATHHGIAGASARGKDMTTRIDHMCFDKYKTESS